MKKLIKFLYLYKIKHHQKVVVDGISNLSNSINGDDLIEIQKCNENQIDDQQILMISSKLNSNWNISDKFSEYILQSLVKIYHVVSV